MRRQHITKQRDLPCRQHGRRQRTIRDDPYPVSLSLAAGAAAAADVEQQVLALVLQLHSSVHSSGVNDSFRGGLDGGRDLGYGGSSRRAFGLASKKEQRMYNVNVDLDEHARMVYLYWSTGTLYSVVRSSTVPSFFF